MHKNIQNRPSISSIQKEAALLSPKRPRTDDKITNNDAGKIYLEFLKPLTLQTKQVEFDHEYVRQSGYQSEENTEENSTAERSSDSQTNAVIHAISINYAECDLSLEKDQQNLSWPVGDKDMFHIVEDDEDDMSAQSYIFDTFSSHDSCQLGKSLEFTLAGHLSANDCNLSEKKKDNPVPLTNFNSGETDSATQPTCAYENVILDVGTYSMSGVSLKGNEKNLNENEEGFCEIICSQSKVRSYILPNDSKDYESSRPKTSTSGNYSAAGDSDGIVFRWQNNTNENANICDGVAQESSYYMNDNYPFTVETVACGDCSVVSDDAELNSNLSSNGSEINKDLMNNDPRNPDGEMTIETQSKLDDQNTTEKLPSSVSQEAAEGGNNTGLGVACVLRPAISSKKAREKEHRNSDWISGVESPASETVDFDIFCPFTVQSPLRSSEHVQNVNNISLQPGHSEKQNGDQREDKSQDSCKSPIEEHDTGHQGILNEELAPCNSIPGPLKGFDLVELNKTDSDTAGHLCEEPTPAGQFPTCPKHLKTGSASPTPATSTLFNWLPDRAEGKLIETEFCVHLADLEVGVQEGSLLNGDEGVTGTSTRIWINEWAERQFTPALRLSVESTPGEVSGARDNPSADYRDKLTIENEDISSFISMLPRDAIVPAPYSHPRNDEDDTTVHHGYSSSVPSAPLVPSNCVPVAFDTFEKIRLSFDDGEVEGLEHSPLLHSSPSQAFNCKVKLQDAVPVAEWSHNKEQSEDDEKEGLQKEVTGYICCGGKEVPDFHSHTDFSLASPEHPDQSSCILHGCSQSNSFPLIELSTLTTVKIQPEYYDFPTLEMKQKFDLVIDELSLYFEINRDSSGEAASEPCGGNALSPKEERKASSCSRICPGSPVVEPPGDMSMEDDEGALKTCRVEPAKVCPTEGMDSEQEVPLNCSLLSEGEESMYSSVKQKEPREGEEKGKLWNPAFMVLSCLDQLTPRPPALPKRLEPLKTCSRPIRVGLSKKAKTKQLHPYFK